MKKSIFILIISVVLLSGCVNSNDVDKVNCAYNDKELNGFKEGDYVKSTDEFNKKYNNSFVGYVNHLWGGDINSTYQANRPHLDINAYHIDTKKECVSIDNITYCKDNYSDFDMGCWIQIFDDKIVVHGVNKNPCTQNIYVHNTSWIEHI